MSLYRQHSDDLNAYLYHHKSQKGRVRAGAVERHECCERPTLTPPPQPWRPAPPIRQSSQPAPNQHRRLADPGNAGIASTLPRSMATLVDVPGGTCGVVRSQISSRQQPRVRYSVCRTRNVWKHLKSCITLTD